MSLATMYDSLGSGWNSLNDSIQNQAIDFEHSVLGSGSECMVRVCESTEELSQQLELSGNLSADHTLAKFEAKAEFLRDISRKSNSVTILVKSKQTWSARIKSARFKTSDDMKEAIKDATKLVAFAGDSYINYVQVGAEYFAAYQFHAFTSEGREKILAEAQGKFGAITTVTASVKADLDTLKNKSESSFSFFQKSIGVNGNSTTEEAISFALNLGKKEISPELLKFGTAPYSSLLNAPRELSRANSWIKAYMAPDWYHPSSIKDIERHTRLVRDRIRAVRALYSFYKVKDVDQSFLDHENGCNLIDKTIQEWKSGFENGNGELKRPILDTKLLAIPYPNFELESGKMWGRKQGGQAWDDLDPQIIFSFVYPKTFKGRGNSVLNSFTTLYACRNPREPDDVRLETTFERTHGRQDGPEQSIGHHLSPDQVGWTGLWSKSNFHRDDLDDPAKRGIICGMEVRLRPNQAVSHAQGNDDGPFSGELVPEGATFIGFRGRAEEKLDALQPVYVRFKPASWKLVLPSAD